MRRPVEPTTPPPRGDEEPDPRWQFFTDDTSAYTSPWFPGRRRLMIDYGCTDAPFYDPSPRCTGGEGFHHGVDVALPCDTPLTAGRSGTVLPRDAPGAPGTAYGDAPLRIRVGDHDILIGHARAVAVGPGERVEVGQRVALASDSGAPDGCHLHFEVRPAGSDYLAAVDPARWLALRRSPS